ncbi:uncharacterized protein BO80DRAFT_449248 [Aspergillus ibericus CBS 121593]|uniref:C2H2-type domain-containing protein n=1 Tax=Aspergillus ibericus CBS 121593 TaxID=1448316 RepID=A0A395GNH6_9EURO|nr:hypothetical protein BO80DRAFT_449248 [Aspergillus ibericus CBS 121593]RAK96518.1 hypothetical protein BO80DRAFT_449248 [Aspergillus ibericus CBS 121593]
MGPPNRTLVGPYPINPPAVPAYPQGPAQLAAPATPHPPWNNLRCGWAGCAYTGSFTREADLWRHIRNLHVAPGSFPCFICGQTFNQLYNQRSHMRARHPEMMLH